MRQWKPVDTAHLAGWAINVSSRAPWSPPQTRLDVRSALFEIGGSRVQGERQSRSPTKLSAAALRDDRNWPPRESACACQSTSDHEEHPRRMHRQLKRLRGEAAGRCGKFSKHRRRTREWDCWCVVHIHRRCRILVQTLSLKLIF